MKVQKDTLDIEIERWDDPGDYPNAVASGPLPSYDYIGEVTGEVVIELEDGDDLVPSGSYNSLEEINYDVFEYLSENEPSQVNILSWDVDCEGNKLTITVGEFEPDGDYEAPEPDYD